MSLNLDDYFEGFHKKRSSWRDVMQVCLNGHVINDSYNKHPNSNKDFCDKCGSKTIIKCPACNNEIPGDLQDTGVTILGFQSKAPEYCIKCGKPFPWKKNIIPQKESNTIDNTQTSIINLERIFSNFHKIAKQLEKNNRYNQRETININDEYDIQDLLHSLLYLYFDDIRREEWTPSYAGRASRMDFLLKENNIIIEIKIAREKHGIKEIGEELIADIAKYRTHPNCKNLICFIYDPQLTIINYKILINDLTNRLDNLKVEICFSPPR